MPNLLISRLVLNLKSHNRPPPGLSSGPRLLSEPKFADRMLGNIGAPLNTWLDEEENNREDIDLEDADEVEASTGAHRSSLVPVVSNFALSL